MKPQAYYSHFFTSTSQLEVPAVSEGCLALRQDLRRSFRCGTLCHVDRKVPLQNESVLGYVWAHFNHRDIFAAFSSTGGFKKSWQSSTGGL